MQTEKNHTSSSVFFLFHSPLSFLKEKMTHGEVNKIFSEIMEAFSVTHVCFVARMVVKPLE